MRLELPFGGSVRFGQFNAMTGAWKIGFTLKRLPASKTANPFGDGLQSAFWSG
jgi:hypothetical protein